jgi:alkanesulfonate monooxygenase SsuD/methylene tetrahydromethanopterin reductase-like flavin-dependent oxidoreductase (luciferase family)
MTLAALARDTRRLRLGTMVASQSYRNPALAAKMAATVDNISGGRFNYGLGAGWKDVEYAAYGYPFPSPDTRIRQLGDAIEIAKRMWTNEKATYEGRFYDVHDAVCAPKPIQKPHPPIWIGGTGSFTLKIAARHADAVNFAWTIPPPKFETKLEELRCYCDARDRDYTSIRKSAGLMITMAEDEDALSAVLKKREANKNTPYEKYLAKQPLNLVGTTEQVAARIEEYKALGVDHFILRFHFGEEIEGMRLFNEKVKPRL